MNAEWFFLRVLTKTERIVLKVAENQLDIILIEIDVEIIVSFTSYCIKKIFIPSFFIGSVALAPWFATIQTNEFAYSAIKSRGTS